MRERMECNYRALRSPEEVISNPILRLTLMVDLYDAVSGAAYPSI